MITKLLLGTMFLFLTYYSCQDGDSDTASVEESAETELSTEEIAAGHQEASKAADDAEKARLLLLPKLFNPKSAVYQDKESHKKVYKELIANPKAFAGFMSRLNQFRISQGKKPINPADFAKSSSLKLNFTEATRTTPIEQCVTAGISLPENALIPAKIEPESLQLAEEAPADAADDDVQWNDAIPCPNRCVCAVGYGVAHAYAYGYGYAGAQCSDGTYVYASAKAEAYAHAEAFAFAMACLPDEDDNQCEEDEDGEGVPDDCINDQDDNPFIDVLKENAKCITDGECEDVLPPPTTTTVETESSTSTDDDSTSQTTTTLPQSGNPGSDLPSGTL